MNRPTNEIINLPPHSDNVEEELHRIRQALSAVFSASPGPAMPGAHVGGALEAQPQRQGETSSEWFRQRALADRYLTSFQSTAVSWMVCDRLLQQAGQQPGGGAAAGGSSSSSDAVMQDQQQKFFAAQTLLTKCRSDVHELPPESLPSLRDSLLNHLRESCRAGPRQRPQLPSAGAAAPNNASSTSSFPALTTRLALCLSALAVQMDWVTVVHDLLAREDRDVALSVLRVLPEETASHRLLLEREEFRFRMRDHLVQSAPMVFQYLQGHLQEGTGVGAGGNGDAPGDPHARRLLTFEVFHTWIRYVPVHPTALVESPLLVASVQALHTPDHLEVAGDVVVEILRMYPSHHPGNEGLVGALVPLLSQLPLDQALEHGDEDVQRAYCRIVTEMGESYLSLILGHRDPALSSQLVRWVLRCSRITDSEIATITLNFWYRMVTDLEVLEPYEWRQELIDAYTPHLLELLQVCVTSLMRFPDDEDVTDEGLDDLKRHRYYVSETIEDCCRLLGGQIVLHRIQELLAVARAALPTGRWQDIETCLACVSAIHRFVPGDENDVLPACFQLVPHLRGDVPFLRSTASQLVGKFASWLALRPQFLHPLLPYLAQGLQVPEAASSAAVAIKELCECSNQSVPMADPVLQLYGDVAASGRLELNDELQILQGVCRAVSRQIQDTRDSGSAFLVRLVQPIGNRLAAAMGDANPSLRRIIPEIERFTVIVQYLTVPHDSSSGQNHPLVDLMLSTWPLLDAAATRFPRDTALAEKICRLDKHAIRSIGARHFAPLLRHLVTQLVHSFDRTHQSPFLYAASICITEYGNDATYAPLLLEMISAMAGTAFSFLRSLEEMTNHPDVVEELFYLMERMLGHCPDVLVQSPLLLPLFQCAVVGMRLDHHGANKGTLKFLETTVSFGLALRERNSPESQAALERVLLQEGRAVVDNLAKSMVGELPSYTSQGPEILWKLNLLSPNLVAQWLLTSFESIPLPERAKIDFMGALETGLARDEFSLAAKAFQSACERERRFRRAPMQRRAG